MKRLASITAIVALALAAIVACGRPATTAAQSPQLGGCSILPNDNIWNTPIDKLPTHSSSDAFVANIGTSRVLHPDFGSGQYGPYGIPYVLVPSGYPKVDVSFDYADESDPGPYPIPPDAPIEGGSDSDGDRHVLVLEQGTCMLYEMWSSYPNGDGTWHAGSGAVFDLGSNALRPDTWTSADAAGLPILPGLTRYDEIAAGAINHALRFTVPCTADFYIWPARHKAVPDSCPATPPAGTLAPPMGLRFRLKAGFDISQFSHDTQVILAALKKYGMIVADNGSSWYLSGAPDPRWDDDTLVQEMRQVHGSDFEAVDESGLQVDPNSGQVIPSAVAQDGKSVAPATAQQGQQVVYTIQLVGDGAPIGLSDPLPDGITLASTPEVAPADQPGATYDATAGAITWSGAPDNTTIVTISYTATVDLATTDAIANTATVIRAGDQKQITAVLIANPLQWFLPMVRR
jgi:hypothetical protein